MRLTIRDGLATMFVAAAAAVYVPWLTGAAMTDWPAQVIAAVVFGLGFAACLTDQTQMAIVYGATHESPRPPMAYGMLVSVLGALALLSGAIALVTGNAVMLAALAASMAGLWVIATARHMLTAGSGSRSRQPAKTREHATAGRGGHAEP